MISEPAFGLYKSAQVRSSCMTPWCQENSRWRRLVTKFYNFMSWECAIPSKFCLKVLKTVLTVAHYRIIVFRCYSEDTSVKAVVTLLVSAFTIHVQINISLALQFYQADYDKGNAAHNRYWYQCIPIAPCLASVRADRNELSQFNLIRKITPYGLCELLILLVLRELLLELEQ